MKASTIKVEKIVGGSDMGEEMKFSLNMLSFMCLLDKGMGISNIPLDQSLDYQRGMSCRYRLGGYQPIDDTSACCG